ncbi:hypothetical protein ACFY8S_01380 [Streptomyces hygroscopicus]|uniref:hypothetical protein n=1 Tax=Streptomyces hygroscopicus TaxID=1912 RepID=UPI00367778DC
MARCGCGGGQCNCSIVAGEGITIDGSGSTANPYIISTEVTCDQVRPCFSAGDGAAYDPSTGVISARPSTDAGNELEFGSDGGLMVPPAPVTCDQVRPCISAGPGATYDPATGVVGADLSGEAGNNIVIGPDGGLYVPSGSATVTTGCGLTGDGSASAPVTAATGTWPYACDVATYGGGVYCDTAGVLRTDPRSQATYTQDQINQQYPATAVPPDSPGIPIETRTLQIVNPDPCREAFVICEVEVDVDFDLPAGSGASYGIATDETYYVANTGATAQQDAHVQTTKVYQRTIPAGGTLNEPLQIIMGRGTGGATYNRIQSFMRAFVFNL